MGAWPARVERWRAGLGGDADKRVAIALLALGLMLRVAIVRAGGFYGSAPGGEAESVALAFARTGVWADAFFHGQGPTAHLMPVAPMVAVCLYRLFGVDSGVSNQLLSLWAVGSVMGAYTLTFLVFRRSGWPGRATLPGLALLCLVPIEWRTELQDFRFWEGPLAAMLAAVNFLLMQRAVCGARLTALAVVEIGVASALLFFTQPIAGAAMDLCWAAVAIVALRRDCARVAPVAALCHALLLAPWTLRNERALGAPIVTRSNFGLEFAIANHPGALEAGDSYAGWSATGRRLHPNNAPMAQDRIRAIGEVRYSRLLGARAWDWAKHHPGAFLLVSLRHWRQFFMPPRWATHPSDLAVIRARPPGRCRSPTCWACSR